MSASRHSPGGNLIDSIEDEVYDPYNSASQTRARQPATLAGHSAAMTSGQQQQQQQQQYHHQQQQQHLQQQHQQQAYDSMSTILEVDSEELSEEPSGDFRSSVRRRSSNAESNEEEEEEEDDGEDDDDEDEPRVGAFQRNVASSTASGRAAGLLGRVSPVASGRWTRGSGVGGDAFSGKLTSLAQQVERLRGSRGSRTSDLEMSTSSRELETPDALPYNEPSREGISSDSNSENEADDKNRKSQAPSQKQQASSKMKQPTRTMSSDGRNSPLKFKPDYAAAPERPETPHQANPFGSAESLMMIALSPLLSPAGGALKSGQLDQPAKVVEVSNKSTETAIDLQLMQLMVNKYFVETRDQACQSIQFDCLDEFETTPDGGAIRSLGRSGSAQRLGQSHHQPAHRPVTKSVSVGTEGFTRERFSLLPETKSRSTQTNSNLADSDRGQSETRRFKLAHLDLIRPASSTNQTAHNQQQQNDAIVSEKRATQVESEKPEVRVDQQQQQSKSKLGPISKNQENQASNTELDSLNTTMSESSGPAGKEPAATVMNNGELKNQTSRPKTPTKQVTIREPATLLEARSLKRNSSANNNNNNEPSSNQPDSLSDGQDTSRPGSDKDEKPAPPAEPKSSAIATSAIIPSLKTEVRLIIEVKNCRERQTTDLKSESLLTSDGKLTKTTDIQTRKQLAMTPGEVLDRLKSAGQAHSVSMEGDVDETAIQSNWKANKSTSQRDTPITWRQVSESSLRNEIETDTRRKSCRIRDLERDRGARGEMLILSSDACIEQHPNDKSSIGFKSRASKRLDFEDKSSKELTLVESEAAFDERDQPVSSGRKSKEMTLRLPPEPPRQFAGPVEPQAVAKQETAKSFFKPREEIVTETKPKPPPIPPKLARRVLPRDDLGGPLRQLNPSNRFSLSNSDSLSSSARHQEAPSGVRTNQKVSMEEEREHHKSMVRDGRLVYDDRIRELRYETHAKPSGDNEPATSGNARVQQDRRRRRGTTLRNVDLAELEQEEENLDEVRLPLRSVSLSPSSPLSPSARPLRSSLASRHRNSARSSPQLLLANAEATSQLSSDRETLDSGFAHSSVGGSGTNLSRLAPSNHNNNNQHPSGGYYAHELSPPPRFRSSSSLIGTESTRDRHTRVPFAPSRQLNYEPSSRRLSNSMDLDSQSMNFMDDSDPNDDELIRQLGGSQPFLTTTSRKMTRTSSNRTTSIRRTPGSFERSLIDESWAQSEKSTQLEPPAAFRNKPRTFSRPQPDPTPTRPDKPPVAPKHQQQHQHRQPEHKQTSRLTELTTKLSRLKPQLASLTRQAESANSPGTGNGQRGRTQTRLEQTISGSGQRTKESLASGHEAAKRVRDVDHEGDQKQAGSRIRTHVMFESDSDSLTGSGRSTGNGHRASGGSSSGLNEDSKSELITRTKFLRHQAYDGSSGNRKDEVLKPSLSLKRESGRHQGEPHYDYSLSVDRIRNRKVEKRVNTYIKHSRLLGQPLDHYDESNH